MDNSYDPAQSFIDYSECPIPATHRRLVEAHLLWHQTLANYQQPDAFRANLNATIQTLQTVTWALQKEKRGVPNFDEWYEPWRSRLKADAEAKWAHDARTFIVHKGDLELTSLASAKVLTWKNVLLTEFQVSPVASTESILEKLSSMDLLNDSGVPIHDLQDASLEIERKWSLAELNGNELLEVLARVYDLLSQIVLDAHAQSGQLNCISANQVHPDFRPANYRTGILECMAVGREHRTQRIKLVSRQEFEALKENARPTSFIPFTTPTEEYPLPWGDRDPIAVAESILGEAKELLKRDKFHARMIFVRDGGGNWRVKVFNPRDRTEKHITIRVIADMVKRTSADALIDVGESWSLPGEAMSELKDYEIWDAPSRKEELEVVVLSRDGINRKYSTPFSRNAAGRIKLERTRHSDGLIFLQYMQPVFEVWRDQRTQTLNDGTTIARVWEPDSLESCFCGSSNRFIQCCQPLMDHISSSDSIDDEIQRALADGNSLQAERLLRGALAQYVIWIRQHTAATRHVDEFSHRNMLAIDVLALQSYVQELNLILKVNRKNAEIAPTMLRLSKLVGVPEVSHRLKSLAAISLLESDDVPGAVSLVKSMGKLDLLNDPLTLILATSIIDLPKSRIVKMLRKAARLSLSGSERLAARLQLANILFSGGNKKAALREIDTGVKEARFFQNSEEPLADLLYLRWKITQTYKDFWIAKRVLEERPPEDVWEQLATLLVEHGDYGAAESVLTRPIQEGNVSACLLAIEGRLRSGKNNEARELLLKIPEEKIPQDLRFPYACKLGIVALACEDSELKREAAVRLREVVDLKNSQSEIAAVLLASVEA